MYSGISDSNLYARIVRIFRPRHNCSAATFRCKMRMSYLSKGEMSALWVAESPMETERIALSQPDRNRLRVLHEGPESKRKST